MSISPEDLELVRWAVGHVEGIEHHRKAGRELGVSAATVQKWREAIAAGTEAQLPPLRSPMPTKLRTKRAEVAGEQKTPRQSGDGMDPDPWGELMAAPSGAALRDVIVEELRAIRGLDEPEWRKMLYRDSATSLIGQAAVLAAEIARIEAEGAAKVRAEAVLEAERNNGRRLEHSPVPTADPYVTPGAGGAATAAPGHG